ncbi:hypothetical protein EP232_05825, partial [bacterium]
VQEMSGIVSASEESVSLPAVMTGTVFILMGTWLKRETGLASGLLLAVLMVTVVRLRTRGIQGAVREIAAGIFILIVPAWLLAHSILFLDEAWGRAALLFLLLVVWVCDSAAFYVGSAIGRRKLAPEISPNKTVEGFLAGLISSLPVAFLFWLLSPVRWSFGFTMAAGIAIALVGQIGDLAESILKRDAGIKDSGTLIPGHGGILDRTDSLLFTIPFLYYMTQWLACCLK